VKPDSPDPVDFDTTRHGFPDMPQPSDFGGFFSVLSAICQRSPKPLRKVLRIANGLNAESQQDPPDLENLFFTSMDALL
jgi:hypothetical protein